MQAIEVTTGFRDDRHVGYLIPFENDWGYQVAKEPTAMDFAEARNLIKRASRNPNMDHLSFHQYEV